MLTYAKEYRDELLRVGPERFQLMHPHPVLIVLGMGADLPATTDGQGHTTKVVDIESGTFQRTTLTGRVFPLGGGRAPGPVTVGRTAQSDITIPEYSISKKQCIIAPVGDDLRITDLGSTNGTIVDGTKLDPKKPYTLKGGETIALGRLMLVFLLTPGFLRHLGSL